MPEDFAYSPAIRSRVSENLSRHSPKTLNQPELRRAAVAVVLVREPASGDTAVLLTLRPQRMKRHSGQYALPGGRLDDGETEIEAALRELQEELGISLDNCDVLGVLDDYPTQSGFRIRPVVMWAGDPVRLTPDPQEVEQVFTIPLAELDSPQIPILTRQPDGGPPVMSAWLLVLGHEIYAPTAAILYQFREVAWRGNDTAVRHFGQPEFARR